MVQAYSLDLRERVVAAVMAGASCWQAANRFGVSVSAVVKWCQRWRAKGSLAPAKFGPASSFNLEAHKGWLAARVGAHPSITTRALARELTEAGTPVSHHAAWAMLRREGLTFKKTALASEQNRPRVSHQRERWRRHQRRVDPTRLVFVDETWAKTNMAPLRGWASCGHRLIGRAPHAHWRTMTFLAALRHDGIDAPFVLDGPINGITFRAWVVERLVPTLRAGDIVVLDNLGSHRGKTVRAAIRAAGAHLLFLPPYRPDLNPIELMFAKLKHLLREAQERTTDTTWRRIGSLLDAFTPRECANYTATAGYASVIS